MKKLVSCLILLALMLPLISACSNDADSGNNSKGTTVTTSSSGTSTSGDSDEKKPDLTNADDTAKKLINECRQLNVDIMSIYSGIVGFENEDVDKLFDGKPDTKYCVDTGDSEDVFWISFSLTERATVCGYVMQTATDASKYPERNPVYWTMYVKNSAGDWIELDSADNQMLKIGSTNSAYYGREVDSMQISMEYKIEFTHSGVFQLADLILFTKN